MSTTRRILVGPESLVYVDAASARPDYIEER